MVLPLLIGLGSFGARLGFTGTMAQITGAGAKTMGTSLLFGSGYSLGTYIGFPKNYQQRRDLNSTLRPQIIDMSYYGGRRSYSRYPRRRRYSSYRRRSYRRYY